MSSKGQRPGLRSGGLCSLWNNFSASQAFSHDVEPIGTTWYLLIFCCRLHSFNPFHAPFRARNEVCETFLEFFDTVLNFASLFSGKSMAELQTLFQDPQEAGHRREMVSLRENST